MSEEFETKATANEARSEGGVERERGRTLPRLFSEMSVTPTSTEVGLVAGAAGGNEGAGGEGAGDEGGAPREEVRASPAPSKGEVGRDGEGADEVKGEGEEAEARPEHEFDAEYVTPAL